ncbi:MAG: HNH endonuclease [Chloroflexi bacterium]|nr:HNH endonuclease [Chloroflexota bacterium]
MSTDPLNDSMDSGPVSERVKRQVFVNSVGICAAPDCSRRIMQNQTTLGECAHIIPRKVGSNQREDRVTPLEDRNKEENLLYLCEEHHKLVDNWNLSGTFTAEMLREWKRRHEEWAAGINKGSSFFPKELKDLFAGLQAQAANAAVVSGAFIDRILDTCRELADRYLINETRFFLAQVDLLLQEENNQVLSAKADLVGAILLIRTDKIPEAKRELIRIIEMGTFVREAALEYIELCETIPEPDDRVQEFEELARSIYSDSPRLVLIDLIRIYEKHESVDIPDVSYIWSSDHRINARFIRQYALFCDLSQKLDLRDQFIDRWEKELPSSPRPHLFRSHFRRLDLFRFESPRSQSTNAAQVLEYSREELAKASAKDPQSIRDQISWLMNEIWLELAASPLTNNVNPNMERLRDQFVALVSKCYFDKFLNNILCEFLAEMRVESDQWTIIKRQIESSKVTPSAGTVELLFLQALRFDALYSDLGQLLAKYERTDLVEILGLS